MPSDPLGVTIAYHTSGVQNFFDHVGFVDGPWW